MKGTKSRAAAIILGFAVGGSSVPCAGFDGKDTAGATLPSSVGIWQSAKEGLTQNEFPKGSLLPEGQPIILTPAQFERLRGVARAALRRLGDNWELAKEKGFSKGLFTKHTMRMDGFLNGEKDLVLRSLSFERDPRDGTRQSFMVHADRGLTEVQFDIEKTVLMLGWHTVKVWLLEERRPMSRPEVGKVAREELHFWLNQSSL